MSYNLHMNKQIRCQNKTCISFLSGNQKVIKVGKVYLKASRKYNQRYKCKLCNKTFFNIDSTKKVFKEKHFEYRKQVRDLYCSGNTLRDIAKHLNISRSTVESKLSLLANESVEYHKLSGKFFYNNITYKKTKKIRTPIIVFDEMETHEATVLKPISIGIAYDYHNKIIVAIETAPFKPRGRYKDLLKHKPELKKRYGSGKSSRPDLRSDMARNIFVQVQSYLSSCEYAPIIITDGKTTYPSIISSVFGTDFTHIIFPSRGDPSIDTVETDLVLDESGLLKDPEELRNKDFFSISAKTSLKDAKLLRALSAFATFNKLCATLRLKLAVLARSSFVHTQKIEKLQQGLYVFQHKWNKEHSPKDL
jgi:transposase-like protein